MESLGSGLFVLPSNSMQTMSNDVDYEFRQQSDLLYLTGFPEPDTVMVLEKDEQELSFYLFVPKIDPEFEIWNGKRYGVEGAATKFKADEAFPRDQFGEKISEYLLNHETVYYPLGIDSKFDKVLVSKIREALKSKGKTGFGPVRVENPLPTLHQFRAIKSPPEIAILEKAAKISADAIELAMTTTKPGLTEGQIEAVIEYHYAKNGCKRPAYPSIVGSGENATILHYIDNNSQLRDGDLLLVDAGAELQGYSADITRTWPINGRFSKTQRKIYNKVLQIQEDLINLVRPGITIKSLQEIAVESITQFLIDVKLLEGEISDLIEKKEYKRFFMHGIGHWLGIDVHDTGFINRDTQTLQPGHYFTIEPGIYIAAEQDIPREFQGVGIRIEDDVLVTAEGCRVLSNSVPKTIPEIEKLVGTAELP